MGSEHYCLRWNNHQSNLLGVFSQLLESESLVDVTLACTEGPSIRAHKVVLSACSSYFQALFLDHPNRHPIVILKDVRFAELRTLVDFMYKGEVNVEYCQLSALLKTAESLKVKGLADMTNINAQAQAVVDNSPDDDPTPASAAAAHPPTVSPPSLQPTAAALATSTAASNTVNSNSNPNNPSSNAAQQPHPTAVTNSNGHANSSASNTSYTTTTATTTTTSTTTNTNNSSSNANAASPVTAQQQQQQQEPMQQDHEIEPQQRSLHRRSSRERDSRNHDRDKEREHSPRDQQQLQDNADHSADEVDVSDSPAASPPTTREASPGPLALDRPRSRRDSDSPSSCNPAGGGGDDTTRGSLSPLSVHSGPSDMSLSNNTGGRATPHAHGPSLPQSRLPSPHSTEPLAGPSGLPPVQQVPLSLKKEVDWERTEERSASSEMSSDYRLPPDPVSLALGLEPSGWAGLAAAAAAAGELEGGPSSLLSSAGFAAGLAGLARRCGVCLASFPSSWLLEQHAILQHAGRACDEKPFTCEQCGQRYRYRSAYVKHREQNHRARLPAEKTFTCDVCGMQFRYLKSFKKHRLNHALERLRAPSTSGGGDSGSLTECSDQVTSTGEPSQQDASSAGDASPMQLDVEEPEQASPVDCSLREEAASSETASLHENANESAPEAGSESRPGSPDEEANERATISVAAAVASTSLSLLAASRQSSHHQHESASERRERRFACQFCGKCVRSKENLKLHVRKHTGERPFVCLFCGRAFGGKSDLTRHLRIHTGERPYHCEMCGKCFARADYLSKHLTTHIHQR